MIRFFRTCLRCPRLTLCVETIIGQLADVNGGGLAVQHQFTDGNGNRRTDTKAMPAETERHSQTRHFLDVVDHRQHINALVIPAGPCTNHLDIFQDREILDDTAGDTGSGQAVGNEIVIVGSKRLQAAGSRRAIAVFLPSL